MTIPRELIETEINGLQARLGMATVVLEADAKALRAGLDAEEQQNLAGRLDVIVEDLDAVGPRIERLVALALAGAPPAAE